MGYLNEASQTKVNDTGNTAGVQVDVYTSGKTTLYTIPAGKTFYPTLVNVRDASTSLSGAIRLDFGVGTSCNTWVQNVNLTVLTSSNMFYPITVISGTAYTACTAGQTFGVLVVSGCTISATVYMDTFGYLV